MMTHSIKPLILSQKTHFKTFVRANLGFDISFWLAQIAKMEDRLFVYICRDIAELTQMETELAFFGVTAHVFADYETLVYDRLSPHQDIISERIHLLSDMPQQGVLLVALQTLMQRISPPSFLLGRHFDLRVGGVFDVEKQRQLLISAGYRLVDNVYGAGEFALRGGLVDIFAMGQALPFRLDLFDDEIESIRFFNPETQRTLSDDELKKMQANAQFDSDSIALHELPKRANVDSFVVLPAKEFPFDDAKDVFRNNFAAAFPNVSHRKFSIYQDVMNGIASAGIEYYAPLFFGEAWHKDGNLFRYLPKTAMMVMVEGVDGLYDKLWAQIMARYDNLRHDKDYPILPPDWLYLPINELFFEMKQFGQMIITTDDTAQDKVLPSLFEATVLDSVPLPIDHHLDEPLLNLLTFIKNCQEPILLVAESASRREILLELLKGKIDVAVVSDFEAFVANLSAYHSNKVALTVAPIERGLHLARYFCVISETQIFGRQVLQTRRKKSMGLSQAVLIKSVTELNEGALVVHIEHGIGRYCGLVVMDVGAGEQEFIHLKYADDASIYVPITHISLIGKYSGVDSEAVPLSKIGSGKWDKARQKALTQIYDVAAELLNVQARRQARQGISFNVDAINYELFASQFMFEETLDQKNAIDAVVFDMKQTKPMDRLICGDVGFGKTEVAMRAAFIAVSAGYQVALLVPTTLLAHQHEDSFKNRFADWAVNIQSLSRFGSKKHHEQVLQDLQAGKVDIVIGTHRLLQEDVKFAKLGLMIIDEEHRFGVRHKEKIKQMQACVDSLSMTATPIPRTLNMALSGMQDISIIATPPARRLAIKTFVVEKNNQTIKDAILREILRGGQVYYLHNDVASMPSVAESLSELIPEASFDMAHGQMNEKELSRVMSDFYHKKFNVLIASTIIETGIDIASANTIIINRADKFGLAQLHQLRGRVGRSHHQAYCYLLVPSLKGLTTDAAKRLDAISRANTLGAGFMLASEDLEIRGAGEILGKEQSGNMQTIGFGLYMDMLNRATRAIKEGRQPKLDTPLDLVSDINMHTSALIPSDYLGDVHERVLFYKRIASTDDVNELTDIKSEMIDRFGTLPTPLVHLFLIHKIRILSKALGIVKVDVTHKALNFEFSPDTPVDGLDIIKLIQSDNNYRMTGATGFRHQFKQEKTVEERFDAVFELMSYFQKRLDQSDVTSAKA